MSDGYTPLKLLGVIRGGMEKESEMHERFMRWRIRGEWFENARPIRRFVRANGLRTYRPEKPMRLRISDELQRQIDDWRAEQTPIPTMAEAIRQLIEAGLAQEKKKRAA